MLVLYTDGLVERRGSDLDAGIDRLAGLVAGSQAALTDLPVQLVDGMLPDGPDDDVAILVCRANDESAEHRVARHDVGSDTGSLTEARQFVNRTLEAWQVSDSLAFDIVLSASELTTNAINHGARPIRLRLRKQRSHLMLEVRDSGAGIPSMRPSEPDEVSGRGLLIVSRVSERWGIRSGPAGKTVWAQFRVPSTDTDSSTV
jgi:anti-sigma regulatory factor (Ser/Thr protein kinase)